MRAIIPFTLALLMLSGTVMAQSAADELLGQWYTEDDDSKVQVVKRDGKYYGTIIWLKEPKYEKDDPTDAGKPKRDRVNRETKFRKRPIIGIECLRNFTYKPSEKIWEDGTIYDPEVGKIYKCVIRFKNDPKAEGGRALHVRGYIGIPTLGRTTVWYRVPEKELEDV